MHVIKAIKPVRGHQVVIDLSENFLAQQVEIIVIPYQPVASKTDREKWQHDFQSISQWDITDVMIDFLRKSKKETAWLWHIERYLDVLYVLNHPF
ncbi:MAG: hypothetical protein JXB18_14135 [Sedimentisphaerales bacterium]|nr:hypothetical protein [Sedimentisphaerales bacterium]